MVQWPASKITTRSTTTTLPHLECRAPTQWPSVRGPGAQAGLPTAVLLDQQEREVIITHQGRLHILVTSSQGAVDHTQISVFPSWTAGLFRL